MAWKVVVQTNGFGKKDQYCDDRDAAYRAAYEISKEGVWFYKRLYPTHMINYIEVVEYK